MTDDRYQPKRETTGRRLLSQKDRGDWIDGLAIAARSDRVFPENGEPGTVRAYLRTQQADDNVFQAVNDAESAWSRLYRTAGAERHVPHLDVRSAQVDEHLINRY